MMPRPAKGAAFFMSADGSAWNPKNHILPAFRSLLGRNWRLSPAHILYQTLGILTE